MINWRYHARINRAAHRVRQQGLIAYPTEAVWGLGCDPWCQSAVARILDLKCRSQSKGLILIASHWEQFAPFISGLHRQQLNHLKKPHNKAITWLVPDNGVAPPWIVGEHDSLALRVTSHPLASGLCQAFGGPLVSTSANPQGLPAAVTGLKVRCYFNGKLDDQTPGVVGSATAPSEIRHLVTNKVIRRG